MTQLGPDKLRNLYDMIFNLSLNMLHNEEEAEDATQQIFLKITEAYPNFRHDSRLETWAYRIARNHLLDCRQKEFKAPLTFDIFEKDLMDFAPYRGELGLTADEEKIYVEQVKVGCTLAMLQCLDRESRFIYIVGEIFQFPGTDGAAICGMSHGSYRKKLSRIREKMRQFLKGNCGLVNENSPCRCRRRLLIAKEKGRINWEKKLYRTDSMRIRQYLEELNRAERENLFQDNPFIAKNINTGPLLDKLSILTED